MDEEFEGSEGAAEREVDNGMAGGIPAAAVLTGSFPREGRGKM